jgi:hypothetical protein
VNQPRAFCTPQAAVSRSLGPAAGLRFGPGWSQACRLPPPRVAGLVDAEGYELDPDDPLAHTLGAPDAEVHAPRAVPSCRRP